MSKKALITGVAGQDGAYLSKFLLEKGYRVFGSVNNISATDFWRFKELNIHGMVEIIEFDILKPLSINSALKKYNFTEIYNLAGDSFVHRDSAAAINSAEVNAFGVLKILESIYQINRDIKFYQASSSEVFGRVSVCPQTEATSINPRNSYGVSKSYAHFMTINYRNNYNLNCCAGITYNHESPLRSLHFVTRKITSGLARICNGAKVAIRLGNMLAQRDWGYAPDYVEAMWLMMQQEKQTDYIISTGILHSVQEFINICLDYLQIKYEWCGEGTTLACYNLDTSAKLFETDESLYQQVETVPLLGNPQKIFDELGWRAKVGINDVAKSMLDYDLRLLNENSVA